MDKVYIVIKLGLFTSKVVGVFADEDKAYEFISECEPSGHIVYYPEVHKVIK